MVKNACYPYREPKFVAHKSDVCLQPLMAPDPWDLTSSSKILGHLNKSAYVHTDTHRQTHKRF